MILKLYDALRASLRVTKNYSLKKIPSRPTVPNKIGFKKDLVATTSSIFLQCVNNNFLHHFSVGFRACKWGRNLAHDGANIEHG